MNSKLFTPLTARIAYLSLLLLLAGNSTHSLALVQYWQVFQALPSSPQVFTPRGGLVVHIADDGMGTTTVSRIYLPRAQPRLTAQSRSQLLTTSKVNPSTGEPYIRVTRTIKEPGRLPFVKSEGKKRSTPFSTTKGKSSQCHRVIESIEDLIRFSKTDSSLSGLTASGRTITLQRTHIIEITALINQYGYENQAMQPFRSVLKEALDNDYKHSTANLLVQILSENIKNMEDSLTHIQGIINRSKTKNDFDPILGTTCKYHVDYFATYSQGLLGFILTPSEDDTTTIFLQPVAASNLSLLDIDPVQTFSAEAYSELAAQIPPTPSNPPPSSRPLPPPPADYTSKRAEYFSREARRTSASPGAPESFTEQTTSQPDHASMASSSRPENNFSGN